jgi:glycosyltransferase involved in cell wall biosynthesis
MRILMLAQFYPPTIGGEENHVRHLSIELAARGHEVAVATVAQGHLPEREIDCGVRIYRIRASTQRMKFLYTTPERHAPPLPDPELVLELSRVVRQERPQIVHAHNWLVYAFLPLKSWSGAKVILTLHDYSLACVQKRLMHYGTSPCDGPGFTKCLKCAATHYGPAKGALVVAAHQMMGTVERRSVNMFLAVSGAVAVGNRLRERRLPFRVIPNFVPDDVAGVHEDAEAAAYTRQLPAEPYLLYAGALTRDKGVDVLLRAYARLTACTAVPPLVLIGHVKRETASILEDVPEGVVLLKNWPHHAVMQAFRLSLAALVPSVWEEPCPTVAMEAMAAGRPVVASRMGGLPDLIAEGETGFLVPPGDVAALRHAIEQLLTDPGLRARMGRAALRRVTAFQAATVVPRIEQVYEQVALHPESVKASPHGIASWNRTESDERESATIG